MNICVTSINFNNYTVLSNLTWPNKVEYAERHGYSSFHKKDRFYGGGLCLGFEKIGYIRDLLDDPAIDWVFFLGCDTLITNMTVKLEDIIEKYGKTHSFIVGADVNGINMDAFLVKNDKNGKEIMKRVWDARHELNGVWCYEQKWFWDNHKNYTEIIKVVPQRTFNSYDYKLYKHNFIDKTGSDGRWIPGDFVIHWPGLDLDKRLIQYENYKEQIVR